MLGVVVKATSWLLPLASLFTTVAGEEDVSFIWLDNTVYFANESTIVKMSWPVLKDAFASPSRSDIASYSGFDWTQPYPGAPLDGFSAHLRIANELPFPSSVIAENVRTNVAAISYGIPPSLMGGDGFPKSMDPSWYICQHYFISTVPDPTADVKNDCSFLPTECQQDLKDRLVKSWGSFEDETGAMCGANALELITPSCRDTLGLVRADVLAWDASYLADKATSKILTVDEVGKQSWMIGTGFNEPNNQTSYYAASNRTYVLATVFGHTADVSNAAEPVAELACLRPAWSVLPALTTTSKTTTIVPATSQTSISVPAAVTSTRLISSSSTPSSTSASALRCIGGTVRDALSGGLTGLCSFSCDYDRCEDDACVCTKSASAAAAVPTRSGVQGCPGSSLDKTSDDYEYFVNLCAFTYSHGYCPDGACKVC
ncbi:hypothetical protein CMUS01_06101 [Colletotrichum musicola]|uniref:Uncharacterized protein n=1 Tax=Colletotrichum musicola TaxID=2175873 RepID=A0A8H6KN68_9PEZI|nr:hypothetical protein CMUS01_06101 [Colletotrichum musicola]